MAVGGGVRYISIMNIALRQPMTVDEYLAWADAQPERQRSELINGQVVAIASERVVHNRVKGRVYLALSQSMAAAGVVGEVFTDGMTVPIDDHTAYEPDALVRCGAPLPPDQLKVTDPVIVVEVKSPTTAHMDTSAKLFGYFKLASVHHYLFIDPDARTITHHERISDGTIARRDVTSGRLRFDPPGIECDVAGLIG